MTYVAIPHHHVPGGRRKTETRANRAPQTESVAGRTLRRAAVGLARRPLLALTLLVALLLQAGAVGETWTRWQIDAATQTAQTHNAALQAQLTQIAAQTAHDEDPATIRAAARALGWVAAP